LIQHEQSRKRPERAVAIATPAFEIGHRLFAIANLDQPGHAAEPLKGSADQNSIVWVIIRK
jgi:hypothetical protein